MLRKDLSKNKRPPGFVEGCGGDIITCNNIAGNCNQAVEFCLDSSAVVPGDFIRFTIKTNANWCGMPYYNCRNGLQNSYCGPLQFLYTQPDPEIWTGACVADEVYKMLMSDYRMAGYFHMETVNGCLVITSLEAYTNFEIIVDDVSGFVPTITETVAASLATEIPYGHVVVGAGDECLDGLNACTLPDAENTQLLGIAARCHPHYQSCGDHVLSSATAKVTERFCFHPGEKTHILLHGQIWVPVGQTPTALSNRLVYDNTNINGLIVPIPYSDPTPMGMIDLVGNAIEFDNYSQLLLIEI